MASENESEAGVLLRVKRISEKAVLPTRDTPLSAGYNLSSAAETEVPARGKVLVPTDLCISIPQGTYARIASRSGLALRHSIEVGAGVVDPDPRGPVWVLLYNHSDVDFQVKVGEGIAQLILERMVTPPVLWNNNLLPSSNVIISSLCFSRFFPLSCISSVICEL